MIMLGTDFPYDQFLPDVTTIQVDTDASVIGRRTGVDIPVHGDVKSTILKLLPELKRKKNRSFLKKTLAKHDKLMNKAVGAYTRKVEKMTPIHPEYAAFILDQVASDNAVFTADTGMCNVWTARYINRWVPGASSAPTCTGPWPMHSPSPLVRRWLTRIARSFRSPVMVACPC